jgi:hypothetical protein
MKLLCFEWYTPCRLFPALFNIILHMCGASGLLKAGRNQHEELIRRRRKVWKTDRSEIITNRKTLIRVAPRRTRGYQTQVSAKNGVTKRCALHLVVKSLATANFLQDIVIIKLFLRPRQTCTAVKENPGRNGNAVRPHSRVSRTRSCRPVGRNGSIIVACCGSVPSASLLSRQMLWKLR